MPSQVRELAQVSGDGCTRNLAGKDTADSGELRKASCVTCDDCPRQLGGEHSGNSS
jgi:hypothetical protein